jgi:hypothetical protein
VTLPSLTELRIRQLEAERDELTAALGQAREIAAALQEQNAKVRQLHFRSGPEICGHCDHLYPCPTLRALTGDVQ